MSTITNAQQVWEFFHAESEAECIRRVYKDTDCGAWIRFLPNGVQLGSIVEGSDAEVDTDPLIYPFTGEDLQQTVDYIEGEASALWQEANGDEE